LHNIDTEEKIPAAGLKLDRSTGGTEWEMGNTQYGHGLSYDSGLVMLKSWMITLPTVDKSTKEKEEETKYELGDTLRNGCRANFPSATHAIKILFNGGVSTDGYHPLIPTDTRFFSVIMPRG